MLVAEIKEKTPSILIFAKKLPITLRRESSIQSGVRMFAVSVYKKSSCVALCCFFVLCTSEVAVGQAVTTYVIKVQEERNKTRWNLTEWLRIKERMKMMDLWLAMMTDTKKDRFSPELSIGGNNLLAVQTIDNDTTIAANQVDGGAVNAQLWFTNLVSSSTGLRTLNIDLGLEGAIHQYKLGEVDEEKNIGTPAGMKITENREFDYQLMNFRFFGKNVQDSSMVFKAGIFKANPGFHDLNLSDQNSISGTAAGGELVLYLFDYFGLEGHALSLQADDGISSRKVSGSWMQYGAFIELSMLRLSSGIYRESWKWQESSNPVELKHDGMAVEAKLFF